MVDLQENHLEFMQLSKRIFETTDSFEAQRIAKRLRQLNQEYFMAKAMEPPQEVLAPART